MLCSLVPQYRQIQQIAQRLRIIGDELDADQRIKRFVFPYSSLYTSTDSLSEQYGSPSAHR